MNELQIFNSEEFGQVRTVMVEETPYFVGKDIAAVLGYTNTPKAIRDHVDEEDKLTERFVLSGQSRIVTIINESGFYALVFSSKMPIAKKFKRWVTSEVLPTLRKNKSYHMPQAPVENNTNKISFMENCPPEMKEMLSAIFYGTC